MARSVNKAILIGNLGKDQETRFTSGGVSVTSFSLATTHSYKGKNGDWVNETTWHKVTGFKVSDYNKEQLVKGAKVYVEGRIRRNEYTDKDGIKRTSYEIVAERIIPLDKSEGSGGYSERDETANTTEEVPMVNGNDDLPF